MRASNDVIPATPNTPGMHGIYMNTGKQISCAPELGGCETCAIDTPNPNAKVCFSAGQSLPLWMVFNPLGAAGSFVASVTFQWYRQSDCTPYGDPVVLSQATAIASGNCATK